MLKKDVAKLFLCTIAATFFAACGDDTTTEKIVEVAGGTVIVESVGDLPECTKDIEGERAWVKTESTDRICVDGKWFATKDSLNAGDFSCTTKELKDKSGIKIVCNGDSIGVVLNGSDGKDGKAGTSGKDGDDGAGCAVVGQTDSTVVVKCGGQTMTLNLGAAAGLDSLGLDSERIAVSLDTLAGVSQKGPFLKGSTVYLYELSDGRTLKQTNGNFVSNITSDDGRFRFTTRNLMSQYALIVVDGKYRNEVTGKPTNTAIRMQAYTDVLNRKNANVNLLTQLEMNRVYNLVTQKKKRFKVAKHQAQMEIFDAFHIDTTVINKSSEDLNVFGNTEADAALLAISILLQGDSNETALSVLLTEIADDMESDGKWDDSVTKARIADWVATADTAGKLAEIRGYVNGWGLSKDSVPNFEKFVRKFWGEELGLGVCGDKKNPFGTVKHVSNPNSTKYYATEYTDVTSKGEKIRFICVNADGARWRPATNIEKDTMTFGHKYENGDVAHGRVNKDLIYVYEDNKWRHGTALDSVLDKGCVPGRGDTVALGKDSVWYKCIADTSMKMEESDWRSAWRVAEQIEKDTAGWGPASVGAYRSGNVDTSRTYVFQGNSWRLGTTMDRLLDQACLEIGDLSRNTYEYEGVDYYYVCTSNVDGAIMGWQRANEIVNDTREYMAGCKEGGEYSHGELKPGRINTDRFYVCDNGAFRYVDSTSQDFILGKGCVSYNRGKNDTLGMHSSYTCMSDGWSFDSVNVITDPRDSYVYNTIKIGSRYWMKDNLTYSTNGSSCSDDKQTNSCFALGRYYTWSAANSACPVGWHLPSKDEWQALIDSVGGIEVAGDALLGADWSGAGENADPYAFHAFPAGYFGNLTLQYQSNLVRYWSSTGYITGTSAYYMGLSDGSARATLDRYSVDHKLSVRCVRDE